uniref:Nucleolar protein 56 n=1 Tax=Lygus hesperus TaxID=30085 RepID=A0A0A9YMK5_LYGHE
MVVQSISLLDQADKDVNTLSMRVREWYGAHFPELSKILQDNYTYCRAARIVEDCKHIGEAQIRELGEFLSEEEVERVVHASRMTIGTLLSKDDLAMIHHFIERVTQMHQYRVALSQYLLEKMNACAPNLTALVGEQVGARLISQVSSLRNLAKLPASTVQILGAEKALFRALKTRGKTPKHGLLYNSSFVGRASTKNKGRISRTLANKCSIAARIDCFSDDSVSTSVPVYGQQLYQQLEERLVFYKTGVPPRKNIDAMRAAQQLQST